MVPAMIIKGSSRGAPGQLAKHLLRADTNERVKVLELQSPTGDLREALRDWQCLAEGTRGEKGLYHANIDPEAHYEMTAEQWQRAVDVLEEELGFKGQPRAVVMHEKEGRTHIHVVWQRTQVDTMTLLSDSWNYRAHEEASMKLEQEFGHEHVPGKHAKRDREKQPELPKSEITHAEWQQADRTGIDPRERKDAITKLYSQCDNGMALKAALESAGYVLAQGDQRDFVIVDSQGEIHSLGRQIKGVKAKDLREFMADIDRATLPTVEQARAGQQQAQAAEEDKRRLTPEEIAALDRNLVERNAEEAQRLRATQEAERQRAAAAMDQDMREKLAVTDAMQHAARERYAREHAEEQGPWAKFWTAVRDFFMPQRAAEEARQKEEAAAAFNSGLDEERALEVRALNEQKARDLADLEERHAQQRREQQQRHSEERDRYVREAEEAKRRMAELEEERRRTLEEQQMREGPERPPPGTR